MEIEERAQEIMKNHEHITIETCREFASMLEFHPELEQLYVDGIIGIHYVYDVRFKNFLLFSRWWRKGDGLCFRGIDFKGKENLLKDKKLYKLYDYCSCGGHMYQQDAEKGTTTRVPICDKCGDIHPHYVTYAGEYSYNNEFLTEKP